MVKSNLLTSISLDIDTFKAHIKRISKAGYSVHSLDKDLLLQKTRNLYDKISQMEVSTELILDLPSPKPETAVVEVKEVVKPKEEVSKPEPLDELISSEQPEPKTDDSINIEFSDVSDIEIKPEIIKEKVVQVQEEVLKDVQAHSQEPESNYDLFSTSSATLSDKFAKEEASIADKLKQSKLEDLRSAIGINEKFLFINELFNGDMGRYNKALDELNSMQNKNGIDTYLMELKIEKQWDEENDAFVKFKELVDRKFN